MVGEAGEKLICYRVNIIWTSNLKNALIVIIQGGSICNTGTQDVLQ